MKKVISILAWVFVGITSLCMLFTMLSTYNMVEMIYFDNYWLLQSSIIVTMFLWSIKQLFLKNKEWINSILCMLMGFGTIFFMLLRVY